MQWQRERGPKGDGDCRYSRRGSEPPAHTPPRRRRRQKSGGDGDATVPPRAAAAIPMRPWPSPDTKKVRASSPTRQRAAVSPIPPRLIPLVPPCAPLLYLPRPYLEVRGTPRGANTPVSQPRKPPHPPPPLPPARSAAANRRPAAAASTPLRRRGKGKRRKRCPHCRRRRTHAARTPVVSGEGSGG